MVDFSGIAEDQFAEIDGLATLLAKHKLVPFFGAGISRQHLGFAAAELAAEMADEIGEPPSTLLADVADTFVDAQGEEAFVAFLRSKLFVTELVEAKAPIHRLLVSLCLNLQYTTNQDNLFELTAARYGRACRRIATLQDLSDSVPGEPLLVKFHGDLDVPSSLVFGTRSYRLRQQMEKHPLDIKLQSDLLGKQLLFLGYSLKDENVTKLIASVRRAFGDDMPPSFLLAFEYDESMEGLSRQYGVRVLDPRRLCPAATSSADAFERCLKALCDRTIRHKSDLGFEQMFSHNQINSKLATEYEVEAVAKIVEEGDFQASVTAFRSVYDQSGVPNNYVRQATDTFNKLVGLANPVNNEEMAELRGALFNLRFPPPLAAEALAHLMAACNRRPAPNGYDDLMSLQCPAVPDVARPAAAAMAVAVLGKRGETITDGFRQLAKFWFREFDKVPDMMKESVEQAIHAAWNGSNAADSPINRPLFGPSKGYHEIRRELSAQFPKRFASPRE